MAGIVHLLAPGKPMGVYEGVPAPESARDYYFVAIEAGARITVFADAWYGRLCRVRRAPRIARKGGTMSCKRSLAILVAGLVVPLLVTLGASGPSLTPQQELGSKLFFDTNLSNPPGQSCAACHGPLVGWTGPDASINAAGAVYEGAVAGRFGNRKPPSAAYAGDSPILHFDGEKWIGGMFWDGRATGAVLGDPLAEQALGPFLNPLEQNNDSAQDVIDSVMASSYGDLFLQVCTVPGDRYNCIGRAIAAFERSTAVSPFSSKYDYWLKGQAKLTGQERRGLELFNGKAKCANCHPSDGATPLFTDFTYDNIGLPRNPENPFYDEPDWNPLGDSWVDLGLGGYLQAVGVADYEAQLGKHKVPTLRNVGLQPGKKFLKAFGHNGYFKSLEDIVHFYNTRDVAAENWPAPEFAETVNRTELGNLGLNHGEELAIVAFLKTLSDGYVPK